MVRQYVTDLYVPAARASAALAVSGTPGHQGAGPAGGDAAAGADPAGRPAAGGEAAGPVGADSYAGARRLADWKRRVTAAWPGVRVDHVEADDGALTPGGQLTIRASIVLGELTPDDVAVEVVYGQAGDDDEIIDPVRRALTPDGESAADDAIRYTGTAELGEPGPFGYTVRVLPRHPQLSSPAELGLITVPAVTAGMVNGDLR